MRTAQMWGGPEHGDVVSSEMDEIAFASETKLWADGILEKPSVKEVKGKYRWDAWRGLYLWEGPGADGDTIERLRLQ